VNVAFSRPEADLPLTASFGCSALRPSTSSTSAIAYPESRHPFSSRERGTKSESAAVAKNARTAEKETIEGYGNSVVATMAVVADQFCGIDIHRSKPRRRGAARIPLGNNRPLSASTHFIRGPSAYRFSPKGSPF
jgi:hypothetical protein